MSASCTGNRRWRRGRRCAGAVGGHSRRPAARLERSVLTAADELLALAASNPGAGTIPTDAASVRGRHDRRQHDEHRDLAVGEPRDRRRERTPGSPRHQAQVIARLLVRPRRLDSSGGRTSIAGPVACFRSGPTRGCRATSTWSRGEGWALYGFAQAAADLHDRGLLRVALRVADFVASHLPAGGIPRWDYDAPPGAPVDVSAGVITAAGLFHLASACRALAGVCSSEPGAGSRSGGGCCRRRSDARALSPRSASSARRSSTSAGAAAGATEAS